MRIRREVSSIPCHSASETWQQIVALVTGPGSRDVQQLRSAVNEMQRLLGLGERVQVPRNGANIPIATCTTQEDDHGWRSSESPKPQTTLAM